MLKRAQWELDHVEPGFASSLEVMHPWSGTQRVEIDDADVQLARIAVHFGLAQVHLAKVYNVNVDVSEVATWIQEERRGSIAQDLEENSTLLHVQDAEQSRQAKEELIAAIDSYVVAEAAMRAETDNQDNDLFSYSHLPEDVRKEAFFRRALQDVRASLAGLSEGAWSLSLNQFLHLGDLFDRPIDVRSLDTGRGIQEFLRSHLAYQSERALANLRNAPVTFSEQVDPALTELRNPSKVIEIDYGDLLALQSLLESLHTAIAIIDGYNLDLRIPQVAEEAVERTFDVNDDLLAAYPHFLRIREFQQIINAKILARRAMQAALETSTYLQSSDDPDPRDELFQYEGRVAQWDAHLRPQVEELERSLFAIVDPSPNRQGDEFRLNLNPPFQQPLDIREFLPRFDGANPVKGTLPDPTLEGIVPDFTQEDW